jgi:NAD(P)-dependent dehydrogenase (short-subunit alcohol dehydrogenase family)
MASPNFTITPEKEGSMSHYFYRQLTYTPPEVRGVSLDGQTAIVTGANRGIGFEVSRQLLDLGLSRLILAVRNEELGNVAANKLREGRKLPADAIQVWSVDMNSYDSVVAFSKRAESLERMDIVILNAGIIASKVTHEMPKPGTRRRCRSTTFHNLCLPFSCCQLRR